MSDQDKAFLKLPTWLIMFIVVIGLIWVGLQVYTKWLNPQTVTSEAPNKVDIERLVARNTSVTADLANLETKVEALSTSLGSVDALERDVENIQDTLQNTRKPMAQPETQENGAAAESTNKIKTPVQQTQPVQQTPSVAAVTTHDHSNAVYQRMLSQLAALETKIQTLSTTMTTRPTAMVFTDPNTKHITQPVIPPLATQTIPTQTIPVLPLTPKIQSLAKSNPIEVFVPGNKDDILERMALLETDLARLELLEPMFNSYGKQATGALKLQGEIGTLQQTIQGLNNALDTLRAEVETLKYYSHAPAIWQQK